MRIRSLVVCGAAALALCAAAGRTLPAAEGSAREEFHKVYGQFKEIFQQVADLQERYQTAPESEQLAMKQQYVDLVRKGNALRPKLRELAEKAYLEDPTDKEVGDMMLSLVASTLRADEFEETQRLTKLLIDNKFPQLEVYNFAGAAAYFLNDYDAADTYLRKAAENGTLDEKGQDVLKGLPESREKWNREAQLREAEAKANDLPRVRLTIADAKNNKKGDIVVELFENEAPNTVANFVHLVERGYYDGLAFHRVLPGFMAQGGDPKGDGSGGPGYRIADECYQTNHRDHFRGSLSMAHSDKRDTGGSQFFINFVPTPHLDGKHTVFGRVIEGMDLLAKIQRIDPGQRVPGANPDKILKAVVIRKRPHDYVPKTLPEAAK